MISSAPPPSGALFLHALNLSAECTPPRASRHRGTCLDFPWLVWHYQGFSGPLGVGRSPSRKEKIICKARRRSIWAARRRRNIRDGHDALVCIELTAFIDNRAGATRVCPVDCRVCRLNEIKPAESAVRSAVCADRTREVQLTCRSVTREALTLSHKNGGVLNGTSPPHT